MLKDPDFFVKQIDLCEKIRAEEVNPFFILEVYWNFAKFNKTVNKALGIRN